MIVFHERLIRGEAWFDEPYNTDGMDIIELHMCSNPPPGSTVKPKPTLRLDLHKNESWLFDNIRTSTRYKVRRGLERDELDFRVIDPITDQDIEKFCKFHNETTGAKASNRMDRALSGLHDLHLADLAPYRDEGVLHLSEVLNHEGHRISFQATYRNEGYACLLHSALKRNEVPGLTKAVAGRANRVHYWWNILDFKKAGDHTYDFGGWYHGLSDKAKIPVADFKAEFGGSIYRSSHTVIGFSLKGKAYVLAKRISGRVLGRDVHVHRP